MDIGDWIRQRLPRLNRAVINPVMLSFAGRPFVPVAVIQHTGRRTGRVYTTPVVARPWRDGFVIPLTYARDTDWCLNLRAAGGGVLAYHGTATRIRNPQILAGGAQGPRRGAAPLRALFPFWARALFSAVGARDFLYVRRAGGGSTALYHTVTAGHPLARGLLILGGIALAGGALSALVRRLLRNERP